MPDETCDSSITNLVVDEYCIPVLTALSAEPIVINDLISRFDISRATAYRRVKELADFELLEEQTQIDEYGNQHCVYVATFESINLEIVNGLTYIHIVCEEDHEVIRVAEYDN